MFRVQNNVPEVYVNESRDFQLLCRTLDLINSGVRFDINTMKNITDTSHCNSRLLQLLSDKLGFFTHENIIDEDLRQILRAFPNIENNKGSILAIEQALYLFMRINQIRTSIYIQIGDGEITVGIQSNVRNTKILQEIFKYIIPTGYIIRYKFYTSQDQILKIQLKEESNFIYIDYNNETEQMAIRLANTIPGETEEEKLKSAIDSTRVVPNKDEKDGE